MRITFADYGEEIASSRLRAIIPQRELAKLGIERGRDVLVYGKHVVPMDTVRRFGKSVFDICDDHFRDEFRDYYLEHAENADLITCNSEVMRRIIKKETGRDAAIVHEPYESDELPPTIGSNLLWFGHASNLPDLERIESRLTRPLLALTNKDGFPQWSPKAFRVAVATECLVIIPTGKSLAKSENRMVEAIRCGKYVCAEPLPAYVPFARFFPLGDIPEHIEKTLSNKEFSLECIKAAQEYIKDIYSPAAIGQEWMRAIDEYL